MRTITYGELMRILEAKGIPAKAIKPADTRYVMPTRRWVTEELGRLVGQLLDQTGIKYQEEKFDCDNFAHTAVVMATWCWAITEDAGILPAGTGLGGIWYQTKAGPFHFRCVGIHPEVQVYEPQPMAGALSWQEISMRPVELTKEEFESCVDSLWI